MARARQHKATIWMNAKFGLLSAGAKLLLLGLQNLADRDGRLEDEPATFRAFVFPFQPATDVEPLLAELDGAGLAVRYLVHGGRYIDLVGFTDPASEFHQRRFPDEPSRGIPPRSTDVERARLCSAPLYSSPLHSAPPLGGGAESLFDRPETAPVAEPPSSSDATSQACDVDRADSVLPPPRSAIGPSESLEPCSPPEAQGDRHVFSEYRKTCQSPAAAPPSPPGQPDPRASWERMDPHFVRVYLAHPKKKRMRPAYDVWKELSPTAEVVEQMLASLARSVNSPDWQARNGRWVPLLENWLKFRQWEDDLPVLADRKRRERHEAAARAREEKSESWFAAGGPTARELLEDEYRRREEAKKQRRIG